MELEFSIQNISSLLQLLEYYETVQKDIIQTKRYYILNTVLRNTDNSQTVTL